jgi:methionine synthase I (cobalamin-dependent)
MKAAIEGVRRVAPGIALVTTMTFDTRGYTMMGVSPEQAVEAMVAWGADAVGGNCGNGPDELVPVIEKMRTVDPEAVLVAKSNAGMPELVDMRAVYRADPPSMAAYGVQLHEAGARIVGACCGSSPDHLRAMHAALTPAAT